MSCRVRELVAHRALPGRVARPSKSLETPRLAFLASSSCRGLALRVAFPASFSCRGLASFEWPSRQAPLAGALCLGLNTLFLNGSKELRRILAVTWKALPRVVATARAQVRGTKVPPL